MIRVLIADDQAMVRAGLRLILEAEDDIVVVAEAENGKEGVPAVLAAFSSAICRRRVRIESLCTRRACPILEPNLSA